MVIKRAFGEEMVEEERETVRMGGPSEGELEVIPEGRNRVITRGH